LAWDARGFQLGRTYTAIKRINIPPWENLRKQLGVIRCGFNHQPPQGSPEQISGWMKANYQRGSAKPRANILTPAFCEEKQRHTAHASSPQGQKNIRHGLTAKSFPTIWKWRKQHLFCKAAANKNTNGLIRYLSALANIHWMFGRLKFER